MTTLEISPTRVIHIRFGRNPERAVVIQKLHELAVGMRRRGVHDVLVDAQDVAEFDTELDLQFLNWIVLYYHELRRIAVVTEVEHCRTRVERIAFITGKAIRMFDDDATARDWLGE